MSEQKYAHYTSVVQAMNGYVNGTIAKAVCGIEFVPSNDPEKFPVCPECQSLYDIKKALQELTDSGLLAEGFVLGIEKKKQTSITAKEIYQYVIADLTQDVGWEPEALETTLNILKQRLHIITEVHPKVFDEETSSE